MTGGDAEVNGSRDKTSCEAAALLARGLALCRPDPGEKKPTYRGWPTRSLAAGDFAEGDLFGVLGGPLSDGNRPGHSLVIIDLDAPAAVETGDCFLPPTGLMDGREGKPKDHRYFLVPNDSIPPWAHSKAEQASAAAEEQKGHPGPFLKHFKHAETKKNLLDFIGTGGQAVCPSPGGRRSWVGGTPCEPAVVTFAELWEAAVRLALRNGGEVPRIDEAPEGRASHARCGDDDDPGWDDFAAGDGLDAAVGAALVGVSPRLLRRVVAYLGKVDPAVSGQDGHGKTYWPARVACWGFGLGRAAGFAALWKHFNPRCKPPWSEAELRHKCEDADTLPYGKRRGWLLAEDGEGAACDVAEAADDPHRLARVFLAERRQEGASTLRWWRGEWQEWDGLAYRPRPDGEVRAALTRRVRVDFEDAARRASPPATVRKVTGKLVADVTLAAQSSALLPGDVEAPSWLGGAGPFPADEALVCRNGVLHLPAWGEGREARCPLTPCLFARNALPYDFDPAALAPTTWLRFLWELWPDDAEAINLLQEWFGYALQPDTRHHKILMVVGPPRSGKGTVGRVMRAVVGAANVCAPTLAGLAGPFGLQPLLDKTLAIISDARLSGRTDSAAVVERLLSVSGEDAVTVDRKHLGSVTCRLPVRFVVLTNELPRLADTSGAFASRLLVLRQTRSWLGKEDTSLTERLLAELPGILLWALAGWKRLRERGCFVQPESGKALLDDLADLTSPVGAFVREWCDVGPGHQVGVDDLFAAWRRWCEGQGRDQAGTVQTFGRDLAAAVPGVAVRRPRVADARVRVYEGVRLCEGAADNPWKQRATN
jgi:putative DNA primase/helicase